MSTHRQRAMPAARGGAQTSTAAAQVQTKTQIYVLIGVLISLFLPVIFNAGPIALPASRLFVLLMFVPCLIAWLKGASGPKRVIDYVIFVFSIWIVLSLLVVSGPATIQLSGSIAAETTGAYLLGRWCIQNKDAFLRFVRFQFLALVLLLPLAFLETMTGDPMIIRIFGSVFQSHPIVNYEPRLGLQRVQSVFQHPILYGYFAAVTFSLVVYTMNYHGSAIRNMFRVAVTGISTFLSLSSGPLAGFAVQGLLMIWDRITKNVNRRWTIVLVGIMVLYFAIDLLSNRTPFHVFITYLTFNTGTAYNRILIFEYGWKNIIGSPVFGIGLNDWVRPVWMSPSVDNFFVAWGLRHGLPGLIMLMGLLIGFIIQIGRKVYADPVTASIRLGVSFSTIGTIFIGATVFLWGPVYVWLWFFIGASMWLLNDEPEGTETSHDEEPQSAKDNARRSYTRFTQPVVRTSPR